MRSRAAGAWAGAGARAESADPSTVDLWLATLGMLVGSLFPIVPTLLWRCGLGRCYRHFARSNKVADASPAQAHLDERGHREFQLRLGAFARPC